MDPALQQLIEGRASDEIEVIARLKKHMKYQKTLK